MDKDNIHQKPLLYLLQEHFQFPLHFLVLKNARLSWGIPQAISPLVQMKKNAAFLGCAEWPASGHSSCGGGLAGFHQPGALVQCATCAPIRGGSDLVETWIREN